MTTSNQDWKVLSFRDDEDVPAASVQARTTHIHNRAMEKFGLHVSEINAEHTPGYPGTQSLRNVENGGVETLHVFELQISAKAAERLSLQYHPEILLISNVVEPRKFPLGARDPKELKKGPKPF